jgi:Transposase DNA-binding
MSSAGLGEVGTEYEDAEFGDTRLGKRLIQLASMLSVEPDA